MQKTPQAYRNRSYRDSVFNNNFIVCNVTIQESDLLISSDRDLRDLAYALVLQERDRLLTYIRRHPDFVSSLVPWHDDPFAPPIVREMIEAGIAAGVGPMAAVAGAIAELVGRKLRMRSRNVIVENGGDVFMDVRHDLQVGIFSGPSAFKDTLVLRIRQEEMPIGICTSSGTVGHSLSLGRADAVCVKAVRTALADAVATALGNQIHDVDHIQAALEIGIKIPGVLGVLIVFKDKLGAMGSMELM